MSSTLTALPKAISYLDLFSGTGGFALGLRQAGFVFKQHYFSEIDKHAIANYQYNFKKAAYVGDIKKLSGKEIERPDIITFGSPCQDISLAGNRKGIRAKRSGLFFEAVRLIRTCLPRVFVFENVKGIFSSNGGKDFEAVLRAFADIGLYDLQWQLLNTAWFLPQNRERIYLVGHLRGTARTKVFPLGEGGRLPGQGGTKGQQSENIASTITSTYRKGVHGRGDSYVQVKRKGLRRLTPIECERLQGFPDGWTMQGLFEGEEREIADTHRYNMLGNAVSVATVKAVAKKLLQTDNTLGNIQMTGVPISDNKSLFVRQVKADLLARHKHTKLSLERIASDMQIRDKNEVKELTELAIVETARSIAHQAGSSVAEKYRQIVDLYHHQVNLSHRTSQSILLQQYSTPAPIGYLMGVFCRIDRLQQEGGYGFEPSAGNGLLTIAALPERVYVNEVDSFRRRNLQTQGYAHVWDRDASEPFFDVQHNFMAVLTNPPFGMPDHKVMFDGYPIQPLEHVMAIHALNCMMKTGKAAIIIGGHTGWDKKGRIQAGKNRIFLNYLYHHYHVADIIQVNGRKLYSRQGTGFNTRLILISGRKEEAEGAAPVYHPEKDKPVNSFEELFERVMEAMEYKPTAPASAALPLSSSGKAYRHYLQMAAKHPDTLILLEQDNVYSAFAKDALWLIKHLNYRISAEILYEGKGIPIVRIPAEKLPALSEHLRTKGIRHAIVEPLSAPESIQLNNMNKEAQQIIQALRNKSLKDSRPTDLSGNFDKEDIVDHDALFEQFRQQKAKNGQLLYLFETPETFVAFNEDAEILAAICKIGLIKNSKNGAFQYFISGSSKSLLFVRMAALEQSGHQPRLIENAGYHTDRLKDKSDQELNRILKIIHDKKQMDELGAPYMPTSNACVVLDTQVPDSMAFETQEALHQILKAVGGDADNFVRDRLAYPNKTALCKALSAEQTDAVMMAIYNIEAREQGMIIGDQTGIGKGRVAAAMIRYACKQGYKPVFLTEKANLFSDIYRDLEAIGSGRLRPFIVNAREGKTDIKDEDGNVVYQALPYSEQQAIFQSKILPAQFDFVVATYTQFNSPEKKPEKPAFLSAIAEGNIFIMDESHNSSGSSNTGNFLQGVVAGTKGVVFLSATFAKRPDNMPIYAMKTAISDCNMSRDQLVESIQRGGVALQEVLSSQLVAEGQMLRRERSFEGVEVNYISLEDKAEEHSAIADNITGIIRDIIRFQKDYIDTVVEELDTIAVGEGKQVDLREGTSRAGVDNTPYFSKVFNIINQMLFSIKAASVAERAIERLKEGKKPVIAFASTMGSFLEDMEDERGLPVSDGSLINPDFSEVLRRGLDGVMRYTEKDINGQPEYKKFEISELSPEAQKEYARIQTKIEEIATGITLSPIDVVINRIREAGYSVAEVTGRKYELQLQASADTGIPTRALVLARKRINTNDAFRQFNNNEVDVLMINQSGSTGASAHAIPTAKVSKEEIRQRVMIVLQAELDINTEVQKRGRINRTGQLLKPIYDYISSAIPAEMRLMMMLQKKLKSLDANTASNQKQSSKILDVPDFLNKYGDRVVKEYLLENPNINSMLDDPLRLKNITDSGGQGDAEAMEHAAHKVSGRVAVLSVKMQQDFYGEITERYNDYVAYLQQIGEYDLELEAMNLETETLNSKVVKMGSGSGSVFSEDSTLETVMANVLKKPFTAVELDNLLKEALQEADPKQLQQELIADYGEETGMALEIEIKELQERYDEMDRRIYLEKKFQRLQEEQAQLDYVKMREQQIEEARHKALKVLKEKAAARKYYLEKIFRFFYVGRNLNFPIDNFSGYKEYIPTVFLGFIIDWKRKNPFLPSKIKLRFALANSNKYFAMPASYDDVDKIIGASAQLQELPLEQILDDWSNYIRENNTDRKTRHIVTGNLLQAFSDFRGKLVNYTTLDGKVNKGILLPDNWTQDEQMQDKVSIPVIKALPLIKSLVSGKSITTSTGIGFLRQQDGFKIIVPMSRKVAGDIYLDKELLELVDKNNFNRVADKMVAILPDKLIHRFVEIIQDKHNCSVTVTRHQFNSMEKQKGLHRRHKPIRPPEAEKKYHPGEQHFDLLALEAEALSLKLRLKLRLAA